MIIKTVRENDVEIAIVQSDHVLIRDIQSALDFMATIRYETGCERIILNKSAINEEFFHLSTGLAGEILQKFVNYQVKVAIIGDYSMYTSQNLKDFIYEINKGKSAYFLENEEQAIERLSMP